MIDLNSHRSSGNNLPSRTREVFRQMAMLKPAQIQYRQITLLTCVATLLSHGANPNLLEIPCQYEPTRDGRYLAECLRPHGSHPSHSLHFSTMCTEFQMQVLILLIRYGLRTVEYFKGMRDGRKFYYYKNDFLKRLMACCVIQTAWRKSKNLRPVITKNFKLAWR